MEVAVKNGMGRNVDHGIIAMFAVGPLEYIANQLRHFGTDYGVFLRRLSVLTLLIGRDRN